MLLGKNSIINTKVTKNLSSENKGIKNIKQLLSNPFGQFFVLGIVLIIISLISQAGILPKSLTTALASVVVYAIIVIFVPRLIRQVRPWITVSATKIIIISITLVQFRIL